MSDPMQIYHEQCVKGCQKTATGCTENDKITYGDQTVTCDEAKKMYDDLKTQIAATSLNSKLSDFEGHHHQHCSGPPWNRTCEWHDRRGYPAPCNQWKC